MIGLDILDMWSVLYVLIFGCYDLNDSDCTVAYWTCGQCCCVLICRLLGSNIASIIRSVCTGHVVSVVCYVCCVVCSNIVIGLSVLDMWSVFCVPYVAVGI